MPHSARSAADTSIYPASISCATTVSTSGPSTSVIFTFFVSTHCVCIARRCLGDHDTECPLCVRAHGVIQEIRRDNERLADQHDLFLADVKENGFRAVATAFSRGVLNRPRVPVGDVAT
jgi:hypothetical protein